MTRVAFLTHCPLLMSGCSQPVPARRLFSWAHTHVSMMLQLWALLSIGCMAHSWGNRGQMCIPRVSRLGILQQLSFLIRDLRIL